MKKLIVVCCLVIFIFSTNTSYVSDSQITKPTESLNNIRLENSRLKTNLAIKQVKLSNKMDSITDVIDSFKSRKQKVVIIHIHDTVYIDAVEKKKSFVRSLFNW